MMFAQARIIAENIYFTIGHQFIHNFAEHQVDLVFHLKPNEGGQKHFRNNGIDGIWGEVRIVGNIDMHEPIYIGAFRVFPNIE